MALNQTYRLIWIIKTIYNTGRISFEELNRRWVANTDLSGGVKMGKRTFFKWLEIIEDTYGLDVECEKGGSYRYYIANAEDIRKGTIESWMISTLSVSNTLQSSRSIKDRIILENIPSCQEYLDPIIDAMKMNRCIHITHYNYWRDEERDYYVMPLCVKLFRQRWYMVGQVWSTGNRVLFCLDRIRAFRLSSHSFTYPSDFSPQAYFGGCFGVMVGTKAKPDNVRLKVSAGQANYIRALPLMPDQKEVEKNGEYSIFEMNVRQSDDFIQELLWHYDAVEVLEPQSLRERMGEITARMNRNYEKQKSNFTENDTTGTHRIG